jgi:putative membrane protein
MINPSIFFVALRAAEPYPGLMIMRMLYHWLTLVVALFLISLIKPLGIFYDSGRDLVLAALILILANTFIRPLLILFTLPLVLLTLGLFVLIINAIILYWIPDLVPGFHVPSFTSAFFGSLLLSLITGFFSGWERRSRRVAVSTERSGKVIDI